MFNFIAFLIFASLIVISVYFLNVNKLSGTHFVTLVITSLFSLIALLSLDRLKEFDLKNYRLILRDIEDARVEVYAKAEEVKSLMEDLANSYVYAALNSGGNLTLGERWHQEMIDQRDIAQRLFKKLDYSDTQMKSKTSGINDLITWDLLATIEYKAQKMIRKNRGDRRLILIGEKDQEFIECIKSANSNDEILSNVETYLTNNNLTLENFTNELNELKCFLETNYLCPDREKGNKSSLGF